MDSEKEEQGTSISAYLIPERVTTKPKVTCSVVDTDVSEDGPGRATKTLPEGLEIRDSGISEAGQGVWAGKDFEEGTRFGPYQGVQVDKITGYKSGYAWEIRSEGGQGAVIHCIDAEDETKSNWMRYVNCACKEVDQNLRSYQDGEDIFYIAYKPIKADTELLTFYGDEYGRKLGIDTEPSTVATGDTHLCNICGQLLTSVEFLSRHLKYVHQSRYGIPSMYNMNADVSEYLKSVKQGKDLLEKAISLADTSPNTSTDSTQKPASRKSRLGSSTIQRAVKSTRPSKAPGTPKKDSEDLVLLDNDDEEEEDDDDVRLAGSSSSKHTIWSLKEDSDDDIGDTDAAPDPVVCTWFEDVQDWAEGLIDLDDGEDDDEVKGSRDKLSPEQDDNELEWHLCHECGQLFDEEELLEIHVAARHTGGGKLVNKKEATSTKKSADGSTSLSSDGKVSITKVGSSEEQNKETVQGIMKNSKESTGEKMKDKSNDVGATRTGNIFDKFGPIPGTGTTVNEADDAVEVIDSKDVDETEANDGALEDNGIMANDDHLATTYLEEDDVDEIENEQTATIFSTVGDFIREDDAADTDQAQTHYTGDFNSDANVNIEKEIVEVIPGDEDDSLVNSSASRKIEDGMSQQAWRQNICNICRKACHNKEALEEHQKSHPLFQCSICFVSFTSEESLLLHEIDHKEKPFFCGTCGKTYKSQSSLKEHEYSHTGHRPFVCPYCPKGFMRNKKLKVHIKKNHKNLIRAARKPPPPPLVLSKNQFEDSTSVSDVENDNDILEFKCDICSQSFPSKSILERHSKVHQFYGSASSISASSVASSQDSGSMDDMSAEVGTYPEEVRPPRPFKCQLCDSTFLEEAHLQIHVEIHSMDGPWACVICKRKLKQRAHLLEHVYVHWGYKPHACRYCPMDFMRSYEAERHMISHKQRHVRTEEPGKMANNDLDGSHGDQVDESKASILEDLLTKPQSHNDDVDEERVGMFKDLGDSSIAPLPVIPLRCPDDGKNRPYACELCDRAFTAKSSLREHLFLHFGKPYPCDFCERQFTRKTYLISHMKEVHPEADTSAVEDSVLDGKYEELINKALERHQSVDQKKMSQPDVFTDPNSNRPYACKICDKRFQFSYTLKKHMQAHIKLKPLLCDFCERRFVRQSYLDDHIKNQHPPGSRSKDPNKPFKCEICDLTFSKRAYLKDHRFRHKLKKPFPCSFCTKSFRRKCLLLMHTSRHHPNEHQLMASNEPKGATAPRLPGSTSNTLKIKLPFQKQMSADASDSSLSKDPLMCHECGTTFSSVANVRRHMRIHSGERPFKCKFCSWSFNRKEVWKGHMKKKHAEELRAARNKAKPGHGKIKTEGFNCDKCGGSFKSSYALSVHLRQHSQGSSSRPFKCPLCDLAFIRQSDRTKHLKFVHGLDQADIDASALNKKEIKVEPGTPPPSSTPQTVALPAEVHVCHRCGARFDSFWGLESHSRVHEKHSRFPRPYRCIECGAAFKGLSNHTRHMRVHTPEYILETKKILSKMPGRKSRVQTSTTNLPVKPTVAPADTGPFLSGKDSRPHVCPKCGTSYKYARNLRKHIPRHIKSSDRPFQCKICGIYAKTKTSITKHSQIHGPQATSRKSSYDCQKCGRSFRNKQELMKHLAVHTQSISSQSMFKCKYCNAGFKHRGSLTIHERSHSKLNFGFKWEKTTTVKTPDIFRNGSKKVFVIKGLQCPVCMKTFTRRSGVSNHKKVHPDVEFVWEEELRGSVDMTLDRPYQCSICLMRFMRRSGLSNHMHSHRIKGSKSSESPAKPPAIPENSGFLLNTDNEQATPHAEERPYSCEQCMCTFKTKGSLTTHTKVHSHDKMDERNHVCDICECRFISSTNLKKHQRVHTGQPGTPKQSDPVSKYSQLENSESIDIKTKRPFRCRLCGETFKAKHLLDDHIQIHSVSPRQSVVKPKELGTLSADVSESSGEAFLRMTDRPFPCPTCGDRFRLKTTLYKHMRLHRQSAGKPFRCTECGLGFYSIGNMTKHLKRAHRRFSNNVEDEPVAEILDSLNLKVTPEPVSPSVSSPNTSARRSPSKARPFSCKYCGDTFTMRCNMNRHRKRHETGDNLPFRCTHCGFGFKSTKERTKHIVRVHNRDPKEYVSSDPRKPIRTGMKTYKCPICGDNFTDSSGIYKHLRVHAKSANKPYKCEICKIGYNTMVGLSRHRGRVNHYVTDNGSEGSVSVSKQSPRDIKPDISTLQTSSGKTLHKCRYCPATYRDRSSVWRHERVHKLGVSNSRPFSCKTCGLACFSRSHLERHVQMHRRAPGFGPDMQSRKKSTSDRCKRCGLAFRTKSLYLVHMKRCSRTSSFVCKICSVPFSNQIMLTKHVRQDHGGYQRDVINFCGRSIVRETGADKKFCCDQCDQRYKRPSELEKHLRRHALGLIRSQEDFSPLTIKQEEDIEVNVETLEESYEENLSGGDRTEETHQLPEMEVPSTSSGGWCMTAGRTPVHNRTNKSDRARPFVCQTCGFAFMTVIHLRKHTRLHTIAHTKPYVCKICTLGYTRLLDYHRHCNVVHPWGKGNQNEVRCPRCKEKFEAKSDLVEHLEKQTCKFVDDLPEVETSQQGGSGGDQSNEVSDAVEGAEGNMSAANRQGYSNRDLTCPICNYQFLAKPHLETHMKVHDNWENQPYRCERCQIGYSTKQHLTKHVNMNALCIKLAREKERKRILDEKNDLLTNSSTELDAAPEETVPQQFQLSQSGKVKRHICHHCNKSFVKKSQLRIHLEYHKPSPDRPHVCAKCGMGYKTLSNYAKHMKWEHSRPAASPAKLTAAIYMCRDCGYSVTKKSLLEEHTRFGCPKKKENPATEAPQACPVCGNYFNSSVMLCIHIHEHIYHKLFKCSKCPLRFSNPEERKKHEQNHPDWNEMLLQLLSSEFNRRLNPEDGQGVRVKTEPGLEEPEEPPAPYVPEKVLQDGPASGVLVVKPEPVDEPEYNYDLGSLQDSALGDYQALLPDDSDNILPSILQQTRRPEVQSSSASRLEKIVSNLAAQKPSSTDSRSNSSSGIFSGTSLISQRRPSSENVPCTSVAVSASVSSVVTLASSVSTAASDVDEMPDSETLAKQVTEVLPSNSPRVHVPDMSQSNVVLTKKSVEQKPSPKQKLFRCRYCPSAFRLKGLCMAHERQAHRKIYSKASGTSKQPLKDLSKMSVCDICNAVFEQQSSLSRHMLFKHGVPLKPKEPERDDTVDKAEIHHIADNDGPIITSITSQGNVHHGAAHQRQPSLLQQRLEAPLSPSMIPSSSSGQTMSRLESLLTGRSLSPTNQSALLSRGELDYRPYRCDKCNFAFTQRHHLVRHIKRDSCAFHVLGRKAAAQLKEGDTGSKPSPKNAQGMKIKVPEKKHKCTKCPRAFWKRVRLENHMRIHHGEGLYKCQFCAQEYKLLVDCSEHEESCPFGPGAMDDLDLNGGDLGYEQDVDFGQAEDLDLRPDTELEQAQEQAFAEDQNEDFGFENSNHLSDPLDDGIVDDDREWMGIQIKQEPLD